MAGILFIIVANPLGQLQDTLESFPSEFSPQDEFGQPGGGFPTQEQMREFMQEGESPPNF